MGMILFLALASAFAAGIIALEAKRRAHNREFRAKWRREVANSVWVDPPGLGPNWEPGEWSRIHRTPRPAKLTDGEKEEIKQLRLDEKEIQIAIDACRRNLAVSTREFDVEHYQKRIAALKDKQVAVRGQIAKIESGELRPENHRHRDLIPVESGNDVVAWICGDADCAKQLDETDPSVKAWIEAGVRRAKEAAERAEADRKWNEIWAVPERAEAKAEEAKLRQEFNQGNWSPERAARHKQLVNKILADENTKREFVELARKRNKALWGDGSDSVDMFSGDGTFIARIPQSGRGWEL